jgi:hypothetical protein
MSEAPPLACRNASRAPTFWSIANQADCPSTSSPSGITTHGCLLLPQICRVGRSQEVSSSVPPRTRYSPSLGKLVIQDPHSGQTSRVLIKMSLGKLSRSSMVRKMSLDTDPAIQALARMLRP